jgi:hypothetical protein
MSSPPQLRQPCPPGACDCERERLLDSPDSDMRILLLTRNEEQRLLERLENLKSLDDLRHMQQRMYEQLGIRVEVAPGLNEVRSMRGIAITIAPLPGLCRKTRQAIPAAIRRGLERQPEIAYRLLDSHDLLGG